MLHWRLQKLEDLTENDRQITYGVVKPGPEDPVDGVKFIRGGDIYEGRILAENLRTITADVSSSYRRTLLKGGELVVSLVGNPGHVAIVPGSLAGANLARQAGLVALRPDVDAHFVKYFLMSPLGRAELFSQMTGSVQVVINLANLRGVRVPLPPLPIQRRIAGILSAYDDLIENSQRRIKILEEMARRLYREWFVHFRFPGHENCRFVESPLGEIPEGWEVASIDQICTRVTDGSHYSPKSVAVGLPMASSKDMHAWGLNLDSARRISVEDFQGLVRNDCRPRKHDVLITKDGANYLKYIFVMRSDEDVVLLSSVAILRANDLIDPHLLAAILKDPAVKARLGSFVSGAAIPRIVLKDFKRFDVLLPPRDIQKSWAILAWPLTEQIWCLIDQIQNLRRTRDLLLPRLLSGQIDVEALDHA
jgi:type I restriction enzyme S subunit